MPKHHYHVAFAYTVQPNLQAFGDAKLELDWPLKYAAAREQARGLHHRRA